MNSLDYQTHQRQFLEDSVIQTAIVEIQQEDVNVAEAQYEQYVEALGGTPGDDATREKLRADVRDAQAMQRAQEVLLKPKEAIEIPLKGYTEIVVTKLMADAGHQIEDIEGHLDPSKWYQKTQFYVEKFLEDYNDSPLSEYRFSLERGGDSSNRTRVIKQRVEKHKAQREENLERSRLAGRNGGSQAEPSASKVEREPEIPIAQAVRSPNPIVPSSQRNEQPSNQPVEQPRNERNEQPSNQPIEQPRNERIEQPRNERNEQPSDQPIEQPSNQPIEQPSSHRDPQQTLNARTQGSTRFEGSALHEIAKVSIVGLWVAACFTTGNFQTTCVTLGLAILVAAYFKMQQDGAVGVKGGRPDTDAELLRRQQRAAKAQRDAQRAAEEAGGGGYQCQHRGTRTGHFRSSSQGQVGSASPGHFRSYSDPAFQQVWNDGGGGSPAPFLAGHEGEHYQRNYGGYDNLQG